MSSVKISGDTSGVITVAAPAVSGTNTITMPASTGTMALTSDIPAGGGQTLLSTLTTTSGTTHTTATLDLSTYKTLQVFIWSVGSDAGTTPILQWKNNGGTYVYISNNIATIDAAYGFLYHDLTTGVFMFGRSEAHVPGETVQNRNGAGGIGVNQIITTTTSISFNWDGGQTFDSGTIKIYGLK